MNTAELKKLAEAANEIGTRSYLIRFYEAANPAAILELLARLAAVEQELEAEREETKRWINAAKWEKEIRQEAEKIADKAVIELEALKRAISEAEPVAFNCIGEGLYYKNDPYFGVHGAFQDEREPLYTLKGIK